MYFVQCIFEFFEISKQNPNVHIIYVSLVFIVSIPISVTKQVPIQVSNSYQRTVMQLHV
jgi:hypothetical protein